MLAGGKRQEHQAGVLSCWTAKITRVLLGRKSSAMGAGDSVTALCREVVGGHALLFWVFLGVERGARAVVEMKCDLGERRCW